jgi:hypothetical protein
MSRQRFRFQRRKSQFSNEIVDPYRLGIGALYETRMPQVENCFLYPNLRAQNFSEDFIVVEILFDRCISLRVYSWERVGTASSEERSRISRRRS